MNKVLQFNHTSLPRKNEKGLVLIVALIMVLLMTIVALSSIRGSGLQEAMAGNMRDRNLAFQSCEAALSEGESLVNVMVKSVPQFKGANGLYADLGSSPSASVNYFADADWTAKAQPVSFDLPNVSQKSRYIVESVKGDSNASAFQVGGGVDQESKLNLPPRVYYRVSCQGFGVSQDSHVLAQSTYARSK